MQNVSVKTHGSLGLKSFIMDISALVGNRQSSQKCIWCDPLKRYVIQNSSNRKMEEFLRLGTLYDKTEDMSYVCGVLRLLVPYSYVVHQMWKRFDSDGRTADSFYPVLSRRRLVLLMRLLEVIALKRQRVKARQKCLSLLGIPEMLAIDHQNALDNQSALLQRKLLPTNQALEMEMLKDSNTEFLHNLKCLQILKDELDLEYQKPQPSLRLCSINQRLLTAHQCFWNGLSTHFDCIRELCEEMFEPPITISEMKTFLCYILECDESCKEVQEICFVYEEELPFYQPETLSKLSQCAVLQCLREAGTLPHGLNHLCIPYRLKHILNVQGSNLSTLLIKRRNLTQVPADTNCNF